MPTRPLHPCAAPNCPHLSSGRYCQAHIHLATLTRQFADLRRGSSHDRGYDTRWRKAAKSFLRSHPLCHYCDLRGLTVAAECVDHATPVSRGGPRMDPANWRPACLACNSAKGDKTEAEYVATLRHHA